jgi:hypothetical protein
MSRWLQFLCFLRSSRCYRLLDIMVFITIGIPLLILFTGQFLVKGVEPDSTIIAQISGCLLFFMMGCVGFVAFVRKEFKQVVYIRGRAAQTIALFLMISGWGVLAYSLVWIFVLSRR